MLYLFAHRLFQKITEFTVRETVFHHALGRSRGRMQGCVPPPLRWSLLLKFDYVTSQ